MKKVLLVLGLALCGTFAFAQTAKTAAPAKFSRDDVKLAPVQMHHQTAGEAQVDYKSSIFTKARTEVANYQFDAAHMTGIQFGSNAVVGSNEGAATGGAHTVPSEKSYWIHVDSARYLLTTAFAQVYSQMGNTFTGIRNPIITYMGADYGDEQNNGFMMISSVDACGLVSGTVPDRLNAYFALPQVTLPASNTYVMPYVRYYQVYRKFYDNCYLDYKINGNWNTTEINVTGIDCDVNGFCIGYYETVLPRAVAQQGTLDLRFRQFSEGSHQIAGYGWAVDDVTILASDLSSDWAFYHYGYLDGFYGLIPEGFNIPIEYTVKARNTATTNLNNVALNVEHRYWEDGEWVDNNDFSLTRSQANLPAGDIEQTTLLEINERGFMVPGIGLSRMAAEGHGDTSEAYFQCSVEYYDTAVYANYIDAQYAGLTELPPLPSNYGYVGLPTDHPGKNQFVIRATAGNTLDTVLDRMTYTVSQYIDTTPANKARGITVPGWRWGHDNGIISTGSEFAYQFTSDGYVSDDPDGGDQYYPGYEVYTRFNTPSEIPVDDNGNPYVIRGIELIPTSRLSAEAMHNALISPVSLFEWYDDNGEWHYYLPNTGLSDRHTQAVDGSWFASRDTLHYKLPGQNYNAVNILFPGQPLLYPNMTYYFGYSYAGGTGVFSVGMPQTYYRETADSNTRYRDNPALADYANQLYPTYKVLDVIAYDALNGNGSNHSVNGYNITDYPMIRLIVGPAMELPQTVVSAECNDDDNDTVNRYWIARGQSNMCVLGNDTVAEGSSIGYNVYPGSPEELEEGDYLLDNGNVIDHIWVSHNGGEWVEYALDDEEHVEAHEYNVTDDPDGTIHPWWGAMLERNYYTVYLENMSGEYTIKAEAHWAGLNVKPVESHVSLGLAPNPATSQVRVNVQGVTGKVNCNILDMSGRVIYNADFNAENEQTINLNGVPAGAYFVRVTGDTFSKVERLIVR
ncbi:MAG: T9SS type A sorting domain-containing protein [Bacteroidales bacterium]|nr:T9SS type A sorting domain-containing protein [Bacteroidales bacterium]